MTEQRRQNQAPQSGADRTDRAGHTSVFAVPTVIDKTWMAGHAALRPRYEAATTSGPKAKPNVNGAGME